MSSIYPLVVSALASMLNACAYDAHFADCTIRCTTTSGCPDNLTCGAEGLCRLPGANETCTTLRSPSCEDLPSTCGASASADCCASAVVPGGTFYRSYDVASDGLYSNMSYPATVSTFVLDTYEVTVGRFRKFVEADGGTRTRPPATGAGAHAKIPGSGWDASWNTELATSMSALTAAVKCDATYQTWTDSTGANESLPMNCITWYEAMAFCIWDGGFLPSEAEWNYAAAGGDEQRAYPWSNPAGSTVIDCSYANYKVDVPSGTYCVNGTTGGLNHVGSESPTSDGKWGQTDLAGNVWEWTLDWYAISYPTNTCNDCMNFDPGGSCPACPTRVLRGGSFGRLASNLRTAKRGYSVPDGRSGELGIRCARHF